MGNIVQIHSLPVSDANMLSNADEVQKELIERLLKSTEERWESDLSLSACCCSEDRNLNS